MDDKLRTSDVEVIGDIAWGAHFCQFYQTQEELMDIVCPYLKAGLENNEICIWVLPQVFETKKEAVGHLIKTIPELDIYLEKGQIEIIPYKDWYAEEDSPDSKKTLKSWIEKAYQAPDNGYDGLRLVQDISFLKNDWENLIDYEEELDEAIENRRITAMCTYCSGKLDTNETIYVALNHRFVLVKKEGKWEKVENPRLKRAQERAIQASREVETKSKEANENLERLLEERTVQLEKAYASLKESEKCLYQAQKMAHIGNWKWDIVTGELHWSDEVYRIFGRDPERFRATYDSFLSYVHPDDREHLVNAIKKGFNGELQNIDYRIIRPDGEERAVHTQAEIIFDEKNIPVRAEGIIQDITERKQMEETLKKANETLEEKVKIRTAELEKAYSSLKESEASLAEAQKMAHIGNWDWDLVTNKLYASDEMCRIFGLNSQEFNPSYEAFLNYVHPADRDYICTAYQEVLNGKELVDTDYRIIRADGEERVVHGQGEVVFSEENIPVRIKGTAQDITERKKTEKALELSEERYRIVAEQTGQLIYDYNVEKGTTNWAGNVKEITGHIPEPYKNLNPDFLQSRIHPEDLEMFLEKYERFLSCGGIYRTEYRFRKEDGNYIYIEDNGVCLKEDKGKVKRIIGAIKDITERKRAEETIANIEIARKKEIHHRIKNNLQVISSLLDLQAEKFKNREHVENSEVLEAFRESQDRVISISLIHEELHEGKGTNELNFSPYLKKLVENLFQTYRLGNLDLSLDMDLEENIFFDIDVAVPLGLIVNEIVSNSLKYAFSGRNKGIIRIKLVREESGEFSRKISENKKVDCKSEVTNFIITVSDDGVGLPENINVESSDTLGLQLISILVDQLDGKLELKRDSGTEIIIRFAVTEKM